MAYKSRFGSTTIRPDKSHNLIISLDYNFNPKKLHPVLLHTPHMDNADRHFHIELTKKQAKALRDWLDQYLKDDHSKRKDFIKFYG